MALSRLAAGALVFLYPFIVFVTLKNWGITTMGYLMIGLGTVRLLMTLIQSRQPSSVADAGAPGKFDIVGIVLVLLGIITLLTGHTVSVLVYPIIVNGVFLATFALSLLQPQTAVERLARITEPDLPDYAVAYTRKVTIVWCLFFVTNMLIASGTVLYGDIDIWTLYNGAIAYILVGALMAVEWLVRRVVRRRNEAL